MCTAIHFQTKNHYFGRNLDLEYHYDEQVAVLPRRFPLVFRHAPAIKAHHAMIGMATLSGGYPLFYDATNEHGVSMAALNFPENARYFPLTAEKDNVTPFEFIPWVLGQCKSMTQVRALLGRISLLNEPFSPQLPLSPLHWMICWQAECLVVESTADGLRVYDNPVGVLTNNPPFPVQLWHLRRYMHLSPVQPENQFAPALALSPDSNGFGALGLPGDLSSPSRFVRAAYTLHHAQCGDTEVESVSQFFHMLSSVAHTRGSVLVHGRPEITVYASCCNTDTGVYYYTTYDNSTITGVDMRRENLDGSSPVLYPLQTIDAFPIQNR